ncbi:MAG: glycosyltransferase family 4 protein [Phycisphaerae bacterium]|nr:glycosyltransferase family 4 protein [Phycisphaerae bacterium]
MTLSVSQRLNIAAVTRRPDSASFEHRVKRHVVALAGRGVDVTVAVVPRHRAQRRELIRSLGRFDAVWLHRYLISPWHLRTWRRAARRLVFDFDDPILYSTHGLGLARRLKFACLLRRCDAATVANGYLAARAGGYCRDVTVVPMAVDIPALPPRAPRAGPVRLLWLGSRSTLRYLRELAGVLARLAEVRPQVELRLIGPEGLAAAGLNVDYRPWSPQEQDRALRECDLGLCPMPDTRWSRGKSPYKVLQYMAYGLAWVGSAVGENLVLAGPEGSEARGLCAASEQQWVEALTKLADDGALRAQLAANGRAYVQEHHSRERVCSLLAETLRRVAGP